MSLTLNENGEYENKDRNKILGVCMQLPDYEGGYSYHWTGYGDRQVSMSAMTSEMVDIPEGFTPKTGCGKTSMPQALCRWASTEMTYTSAA